MKSNTYWLTGPRALECRSEDLPHEPVAGHFAATTLYTAVSPGTELAAFRGDPPLRPMKVYPRLVGYCNVARVVVCGEGVANLQPGDLVLSGQSHRSHFHAPARDIWMKIPPDTDLVAASTTYLFHLGYAALLRGDYTPGHRVAVVGLGPLGLMTTALLGAFGSPCDVYSDQESARACALRFGARAAYAKEAAPDDGNADLVVSTSNRWPDWELSLKLARPGGTVVVLGFPGRGQPPPTFNPLDSRYLYDRQLTIRAAGYVPDAEVSAQDIRFTLKRNCAYLGEMIRAGRLPGRACVSEVARWDRLAELYARMCDSRGAFVTAVLDWT